MIINKWKIYCETDSKWEFWHLPEGEVPTTCPVNTSHTVTVDSESIAEVIDSSIAKTHQQITQGDKKSRILGKLFSATKAVSTNIDLLVDFKYLRGGVLRVKNHVFPLDTFSVQIIDIDDVLGNGPNFIIEDYIKDVVVPENGIFEILSDDISGALPTGIYVRVIYDSDSASTVDVDGGMVMYGFNDA